MPWMNTRPVMSVPPPALAGTYMLTVSLGHLLSPVVAAVDSVLDAASLWAGVLEALEPQAARLSAMAAAVMAANNFFMVTFLSVWSLVEVGSFSPFFVQVRSAQLTIPVAVPV